MYAAAFVLHSGNRAFDCGFMNIFSFGMDDLAERIKADAIPATVTNHADADTLVGQFVASYQAGDRGPVILIGHSLGADAVIAMDAARGATIASRILCSTTTSIAKRPEINTLLV